MTDQPNKHHPSPVQPEPRPGHGDSPPLHMLVSSDFAVRHPKTVERLSSHQFIYSALGLVVGLVCIVGGIILFLTGIEGSMSWTSRFLGAQSYILDAAPGAILFIVGLFIIWVTRYELKIQGAHVGLGGVYDVYVTGWAITFLVVFVGCYIYAIATYGFLFGVGLGWLPSAIVAAVVATLWPLGALLIAGLALLLFARG